MIRTFSPFRRAAVAVLALILTAGAIPEGQTRQPGPPPKAGAMRGAAAAKALRDRPSRTDLEPTAADPETLVKVMESDESAWVMPDGQMFFADQMQHEAAEPAGGAAVGASSSAPPTPSGYSDAGLPIHHSSPGATFKLYLDFDGEQLRSRSWGIFRNLPGYSLDFNSASFNVEEQAIISRIWGRVAEDFAPFDIDVTTERPAGLQPGHADERNVLWSIFTSNSAAGFSAGIAGVSLFNLGYIPFGTDTPTFTFSNAAPRNHSFLADVATQENGHMFGLLHDGTRFTEYYGGHGTGATSWGPVMGAPTSRNVTQWSLADYPDGVTRPFNNSSGPVLQQDDIAIIAGKLGFRADDIGDEASAPAGLALPARAFITSPLDVDMFALPNTRGVELSLTGFRAGASTDGGNLDIAAEIVNAAGLVIASSDDVEETTAYLATALDAGPHFLRVRSSSSPANYTTYGSVGEYTVSGRFANVAPSFTPGGVVSAMPSGPYNATWATAVSAGPPSESSQRLTFELTGLTNPQLFSPQPQLDQTARLRFEPAGSTGSATVTVVLRDDGGSDIGGGNVSEPVVLRIDLRHQFSGFLAPLPTEVLKAGRTVPVKFSLMTPSGRMAPAQARSIAAVAEVWASAGDAMSASPLGNALASQPCGYDDSKPGYKCDLKLPKTLTAGQTYWIVAKYLDADGWVRPVGVAAAGTANPIAFVAK